MNLKVRVALALALVVMLVSTVAADAGRTGSFTVDHWHYCLQGQGDSWELQFRAQGVTVDGLSKGQLGIVVVDSTYMPSTVIQPTDMYPFGHGQQFEVVWKAVVTPSAPGSLGTYEASLLAYSRGKSPTVLELPPSTTGGLTVAAVPVDCADIP